MKNVEFWFWTITDPWGRRRKSPCRAPADVALDWWGPTASRIEGSCEVRSCPETQAENYALAPTNQHLRGHDGRKGGE